MILFALRCAGDHEFEGWFRDGAAFDRQSAAGTIVCPQCGDNGVVKAPMAPRVARSRNVEANCDYVGERFTEEARRIHYGESDPRGIYGEASVEDAKGLAEEGIEVNR